MNSEKQLSRARKEKLIKSKHFVYILRCADGTFYTGYTTDPERRTRVHNSGKGAKYTRSRRPVELIYTEEFGEKVEAQRREYAIKQLTRAEKEQLIREDDMFEEDIHDPCLRFQK